MVAFPINSGGDPLLLPKGMRKMMQIRKSKSFCNLGKRHRCVPQKLLCRFNPAAKHVSVWRFAVRLSEDADDLRT